MNDKDMVNDILCMTKAGTGEYTKAIGEACNQNLRQTLQEIRNGDEQFQFELFQLAEQKNFYTPAQAAKHEDIQAIKNQLTQA